MTSKQINLVKTSFGKIEPIAEKAAALFYAKLFELDPKLRGLFKGDVYEQGKKLMQVIAYTVENLEQIEEIIPQVQALGARHADYGVEDVHYETVGEALMWTFEKALSKEFTAPTREAWTAIYSLLAQAMKEGSRQPNGKANLLNH